MLRVPVIYVPIFGFLFFLVKKERSSVANFVIFFLENLNDKRVCFKAMALVRLCVLLSMEI